MKARVSILGRFRLATANGNYVTHIGNKAQAALAIMALSRNGAVPRRFLADLLWNKPNDRFVNLRQLLSDLGKTLKSHGLDIIDADRETLRIDLDNVAVDFSQLESFPLRKGLPSCDEVAAIDCGELLEDINIRDETFTDWLDEQRVYVRRAVLIALTKTMNRAAAVSDLDLIEAVAHMILKVEPATEEAYRTLMQVSAERGDRGAANAHYNACSKAMRVLVDAEVDEETEQLMRSIHAGAFDTPPTRHHAAIPRVSGAVAAESSMSLASNAGPVELQTIVDSSTYAVRINSFDGRSESPIESSFAQFVRDAVNVALTDTNWIFCIVDDPLRALPVDYEVSGSIRSEGRWTRVWVRLVRTAGRKVIWAHRFDARDVHPFELGDEIASIVASALEREILVSEVSSTRRSPQNQLNDRERMILAVPLVFRLTPDSLDQADEYLRPATEYSTGASSHLAWRAFVSFLRIGQSWSRDLEGEKEELTFLTRRSLELAPDSALALSVAGHVSSFIEHRYSRAIDLFDRATRLNPYSAYAWAFSALTYCYIGDTGEASRRLKNYRRIWPSDPYPHFFNTAWCIADAMDGNYERVVHLAKRTIADNPNFNATYRPLIASLGHLGQRDEAESFIAELRRHEPDFSLDWFRRNYPPLRSQIHENYVAGFAKAGVPAS